MSHFTVLVVTPHQPSQTDLARILQPWHEFECTGTDDQYVVKIDTTDDVRESYSRADEGESFAQWYEGEYGRETIEVDEEPDLSGPHKYGWARVDANGQLVQAIRRTNPNKKWDWWVIGGRWPGFFYTRAGLKADSVQLSRIDFERKMGEAAERAGREWDLIRKEIGDLSGFRTWATVLRESGSAAEARAAYWAQPACKRLEDLRRGALMSESSASFITWCDLDTFVVPRDELVQKARDSAHQTFAVVKDGEWFEKGRMGWFGSISNEDDTWPEQFRAIMASIPKDHWLTLVDCHI